jgi:hypothetical protein
VQSAVLRTEDLLVFRRVRTAHRPLLPCLAGTLALGPLLFGCSEASPAGAGAEPAAPAEADRSADADDAAAAAGTSGQPEAASFLDDAGLGAGSLTGSRTPGRGSDDTAPACETLALLAETQEELALLDPTAVEDHDDIVRVGFRRAELFGQLAEELPTSASSRDAVPAAFVADAAVITAGITETLRRQWESGELPTAELREGVEPAASWLHQLTFDLRVWESGSCGDAPGITIGEIKGVPSIHLEVDDGSWFRSTLAP